MSLLETEPHVGQRRGGDATGSRIRTVLVEDSLEVRFLLASILELDGHFDIVGETADPAAVLTMVEVLAPDLLVVDLNLGRSGGVALVRQLRLEGHRTPVAVFTGSPHPQDHSAAIAAGADVVHGKEILTTSLAGELVGLVHGAR